MSKETKAEAAARGRQIITEERKKREAKARDMFQRGMKIPYIAYYLEVSEKTVYRYLKGVSRAPTIR